jgi:hypothetical protein
VVLTDDGTPVVLTTGCRDRIDRGGGRRLTAELAGCWTDLASDDAESAFGALCRLDDSPEQAVLLLRQRLKRPAVIPAELDRLVGDLDDDEAVVRNRTYRRLEELGEWARAHLERARKEASSAEVKRQATRLLAPLERGRLGADRVRWVRAVEVLERIGTPAARLVLKELAASKPPTLLAREADEALRRMERR